MYECAFENISIKAVKHLNSQAQKCNEDNNNTIKETTSTQTLTGQEPTDASGDVHATSHAGTLNRESSSLSSKTSLQSQTILSEDTINEKTTFLPPKTKHTTAKAQFNIKGSDPSSAGLVSTPTSDGTIDALPAIEKTEHNRFSLAEFEINKIWFSFPEPPISPKGKRKIPYTRFDWNLLSSVSPAVTSWLCASKHATQPLKDILDSHNRQVLQVMAALISGSLRHKESLEQRMDTSLHLDMLSNMDGHLLTKSLKMGSSKQHNQQQISPNDSNLTSLRNKKLLNYYLESYLTKGTFGLLNDPNFALVNLIRNYLYFYSSEFQNDLTTANKPDENHLKISINEIFNSWSMLIISALEKKSYVLKLAHVDKYMVKNDSSEDTTDHETHNQKNKDLDDYLYKKHASFDVNMSHEASSMHGMNTMNQMGPRATIVTMEERRLANSAGERELLLNQSMNASQNRVFFSEPEKRDKIQIKNANKMFKPFLNFIGIDAPTGKFYDNLFKEFGSFVLGSLNIKSVDINILGKSSKYRDFYHKPSPTNLTTDGSRPRSATTGNVPFRSDARQPLFNLESEKVITTILSFDGLLLNFSIRQITTECFTTKVVTETSIHAPTPAHVKTHNKR